MDILAAAALSPHVCPLTECQRRYRRKGDLKVHVKNHHAALLSLVSRPKSTRVDKPVGCPFPSCPSGFTRKNALYRHLRNKHQGRRPEEADDFSSMSPELSDG